MPLWIYTPYVVKTVRIGYSYREVVALTLNQRLKLWKSKHTIVQKKWWTFVSASSTVTSLITFVVFNFTEVKVREIIISATAPPAPPSLHFPANSNELRFPVLTIRSYRWFTRSCGNMLNFIICGPLKFVPAYTVPGWDIDGYRL